MADEVVEASLVRRDRYGGLKARLERLTERMHPALADGCDLEGLEAVADALERVALHGDRIEVTSAQRVAAERRAAEAAVAVEASPAPQLVVKQRPPVARPGRGRGFRLREDMEVASAEAGAIAEADVG
jgi:hypothetical protein